MESLLSLPPKQERSIPRCVPSLLPPGRCSPTDPYCYLNRISCRPFRGRRPFTLRQRRRDRIAGATFLKYFPPRRSKVTVLPKEPPMIGNEPMLQVAVIVDL